MCLRALQAKNFSVDRHAVCDNFVCIWNRRIVLVKKKVQEGGCEIEKEVEFDVYDIDTHHFFADTVEKGKKNDHAMHSTCLDAIINMYKQKFAELNQQGGEPITLRHVILWTDNCPNQYRCRQTFLDVASVSLRHSGIKITHRLAVVDQFKGIHDAYGKEPSRMVRELERGGIRSATGEDVFINLHAHIERQKSPWKEYECAEDGCDVRILNQERFWLDTRWIWFVTESREEQERLLLTYPGRVLLCDRSLKADTVNGNAIKDTTKLHQVTLISTDVPLCYRGKIQHGKSNPTIQGLVHVWPVAVANLPCHCCNCQANQSDDCNFLRWRKPRIVEMKEAIPLQNAEAVKATLGEGELPLNNDDTEEAEEEVAANDGVDCIQELQEPSANDTVDEIAVDIPVDVAMEGEIMNDIWRRDLGQ